MVNKVIRFQAMLPKFGGPKGLPIVGNLHQLQTNAAQKYREWAKVYGPVYQIQLGNIPVLVINGAASARILLGGGTPAQQHDGQNSTRSTRYDQSP